jgi:flagellar basal body-associated protein FliL
MASSRSRESGAVLPVIVFSALVAIVAAFALTSWLGSSGESTADAQRSMAASSATQKGTVKAETSTETIVTGAVTKERPRYLDAAWTPLHFKPAIDKATNEQCLSCHQEILKREVRKTSPAGVDGNATLAWYQTLDTYAGDQETFHARHLTTPLAKKVMNLKCNFCHQGHDPRDEAPGSSATTTKAALGNFTLRKQVNPSNSCLLCHGAFPVTNMGLEGSWSELREGFESEDAPNGCLVCHAEQFRTVRHQVDYLNAGTIEKLAQNSSSDLCFGCHGGRKWYRNSYPYPRHPWPGMDPEVPEWAKGRAAESAPEHRLKK